MSYRLATRFLFFFIQFVYTHKDLDLETNVVALIRYCGISNGTLIDSRHGMSNIKYKHQCQTK